MIKEDSVTDSPYIGAGGRLDYTGVRGGLKRPPKERGDDYPYDLPITYGSPMAYDRGSRGNGSSFHGLTPNDTSHSAWDDLVEILGSPILLQKQPQIGQATGVPGTSGDWSSGPTNFYDDSFIPENDEIHLTLDPSNPPVEPSLNIHADYPDDQTDDDVERKIDKIWSQDSYLVPGNEPSGDLKSVLSGEHEFGIMPPNRFSSRGLFPQRSVWDVLMKLLNGV